MNLAIVHYHLNRGGVTQVILNHLRSLADSTLRDRVEQVVVLYGGRREGWPDEVPIAPPSFQVRLIAVPSLEYDRRPVANPVGLAADIRAALLEAGAAADDTVLHVHNHALGKNASLPGALAILLQEGYRQLLQVHDFAEDFRPGNYRHLATALASGEERPLHDTLYPQASAVHYAVLNARDDHIFREAGMPAAQRHRLPNPVAEFGDLPSRAEARSAVGKALELKPGQPLVVYPVRGIRRKNLGEMLLMSLLDPRESMYAVTLAPLNPAEAASFKTWKSLATELSLNCRFDLGGEGGLGYHDLLASADAILTTSVTEGFGMVFLESWLVGRPLFGRNLPEITGDFAGAGIDFSGLYDRLAIPLELVDVAAVRSDLLSLYRQVCAEYAQRPAPRDALERQMDELILAETIDFALLSSRLQQQVIHRVAGSNAERETLLAANPRLNPIWRLDSVSAQDKIRHNAAVVRDCYAPKAVGDRLAGIYRAVLAGDADDQVTTLSHGRRILDTFLDIRRLHPVRLAVEIH